MMLNHKTINRHSGESQNPWTTAFAGVTVEENFCVNRRKFDKAFKKAVTSPV
jgi:hypothetical protein